MSDDRLYWDLHKVVGEHLARRGGQMQLPELFKAMGEILALAVASALARGSITEERVAPFLDNWLAGVKETIPFCAGEFRERAKEEKR